MSWNDQLVSLKTESSGCAIITQQGALCAKEGAWKATQDELLKYITYFTEPSPALSGLYYGGEKYICNQANADMVFAMKGKQAVVLQKTKTLIIAGYTDGQFHPAALSASVGKVAQYLTSSNL
ncbi:Profilin A, putative [Trichomonas vaginalis G3]|uniref:Profilin n=1 Tax=Trichomonas vaginalis (strain ATCC PRA-98 / G3) TaxID=412133 RepID=A2ENN9_TRIV3|nr:profilin (actin-binding protein) family [Trichomonas vaginalis G3]EAY05739.1 Profilin A, putative [Trichomonas vaginalis G3]KAI5535153.1 profilin (actin-binding protein) family [Trichomonas vaginalis G3]|eukprot:XP_001317962.1 Profilin A [Trichomonas vaginalis G3]